MPDTSWTGTYATVYAIKGQAFEFTCFIKSTATANPVAVGNLTMTLSLDGAAPAADTSTAVAIPSLTGGVKVAISAADMTANVITGTIASDTANAVTVTFEIKTLTMSEVLAAWNAQDPVRFEQAMLQGVGYSMNKVTINNTSGVITVYKRDGTAVWFTGTASDDGTTTTKGTLS